MNFDRTYVAVSRQLKVMNCAQYEIGIFNRADDVMSLREWNAEMILKSLGYLKRMNAQDRDIFIRPFGSTGLIFFDDFNRAKLARLNDDGLAPALVIQSSPLNYHGWIKISDAPLDEDLCTAACKVIAERYGGDDGAAKFRQFGRLSGFTNRKPKYIDEEGRRPFVLLDETKGRLAENAALLLSDAVAYMSAAENR
jgi:RepB DNA-primase from phage plasmid